MCSGLGESETGLSRRGIGSLLGCKRLAAVMLLALPLLSALCQAEQLTAGPKNGPALPDDYKIALLIKTTIIAVNQANKTGNYAVLRDLGAPGFQAGNTTAELAETFANQRKSKFDLSPILLFNPKLLEKPSIDDNGMLRVSGYFPTRPQQVNFDLAFAYIEGEWRHFGLGIGTQLATQPATTKDGNPQTTQ